MNELSLFTGAGGGLLGSHLLGWNPIGYVEIDEYCQRILKARIDDGFIPKAPIFTDVREFVESGAARQYRGFANVVTGGFPCQDISSAGARKGLGGKKSSLWFSMLRVIEEVRPEFVFAENSPDLRTRGLTSVIQGLDGLGYECRWGVLGAGHIGAPHQRRRMWIVAHANNPGQRVLTKHGEVEGPSQDVDGATKIDPATDTFGKKTRRSASKVRVIGKSPVSRQPCFAGWTQSPPYSRMDDGVAYRVDRTRATGNGQVPTVVRAAWEILSGSLSNT